MSKDDREDVDIAQVLAVNLKRARLRAGMIQRQVASELDTDAMRVSDWERGTVTPQSVTLYRLARLYEVPVDILFVQDHPMLPDATDGSSGLPGLPRGRASNKPKLGKSH